MRLLVLLTLLACIACQRADPEAGKTVAVLEITLPSQGERKALTRYVRQVAERDGLKSFSYTPEQLKKMSAGGPGAAGTVSAAIWLEDEPIISVSDRDQKGRVQIVFWRGKLEHVARAAQFRERLTAHVMQRWPNAAKLQFNPSKEVWEAK